MNGKKFTKQISDAIKKYNSREETEIKIPFEKVEVQNIPDPDILIIKVIIRGRFKMLQWVKFMEIIKRIVNGIAPVERCYQLHFLCPDNDLASTI